jgi:hypothetical protein
MKVPPALYGRASEFHGLAEQLKDDVDQLRRKKQAAFKTQPEEWRNSAPGHQLEDEAVLLEDFHDALKSLLDQMKDLFTSES